MEEYRNYEYEEEIDLKQLLVYVFRKWRTMLAAAVILGLLLGGAKMAKGFLDLQDPEKVEESIKEAELAQENYDTAKAQLPEKVEESIKEAELAQENYDTAKAQLTNQMAEYNRQIDDYQKYQENSLYMKIDPYAVYKESVTYVVTTDYQILPNMTYQSLNWMGPVLSAYTSVATSVTLNDLPPEGQAGLSEEWDADSLDKLIKVETNTNDGKLTITASAESEIRAKAILQAVREKVESNQESIAKAAGEHKLSVIAEKSMVTVDQSIINDREARLRNITALREAADKNQNQHRASLSAGGAVKGGIKFGVLGGVAGVFLCGFFYCLQFLMNGKLNSINNLKERYQTRILAVLPPERKHGWIDRLLDAIEGIKTGPEDTEKILTVAAMSIGKAENACVLSLAGTAPAETKAKIAEIMKKNEGLTVIDAGNLLMDPEAVRKVRGADCVILAETKNRSAVSDIERETEILNGIGVPLKGFIIV